MTYFRSIPCGSVQAPNPNPNPGCVERGGQIVNKPQMQCSKLVSKHIPNVSGEQERGKESIISHAQPHCVSIKMTG